VQIKLRNSTLGKGREICGAAGEGGVYHVDNRSLSEDTKLLALTKPKDN